MGHFSTRRVVPNLRTLLQAPVQILASTYGADPELLPALNELNVQLSKIALGILSANVRARSAERGVA